MLDKVTLRASSASYHQCLYSAFSSSQVENEALDLHHVRGLQVALQLAFLQPQERSVGGCRGPFVGQKGFEEEHLCSNRALRPNGSGQFVLVHSAGGVAEESRLESSCGEKENRP